MNTQARAFIVALIIAALAAACTAAASPRGSAAPGDTRESSSSNSEWEQTLAAARREGKISIIGSQGSEVRDALVLGFQQKYPDIEVDLTGMSGNQAVPRILNEQAAGQHLTDLYVSGPTGILNSLRPAGGVIPVAPFLTGPDIGPPSAWRGGAFSFADEEARFSLMFSLQAREAFIYNPSQVSPAEFSSWRDLLHPKWKGRIVLRDPRGSGPGLGFAVLWHQDERLGPDFIRQLATQDMIISADDRQIVDWVVRGQYPIAIGASSQVFADFSSRGLQVGTLEGSQLKETTYITPGAGNLAVLANPPHPNAVKVYLNYLLSAEGQLAWSRATNFPSLRRDIPTDHVQQVYVLKDGVSYMGAYSDSYAPKAAEVSAFMETVLRR